MCGILGALPPVESTKFLWALNILTHRGPDGFGVWSDDTNITLGHRRLAILDLSEKGKQPMQYGKYMITFNGEIYNFLEIKKRLLDKGYQFVSDCDTEIIIAAYDAWGKECVMQFNGMWAFAIWDTHDKTVFLSRDRFGVKPLYYYEGNNTFVFASEMKALMPFLPEKVVSDNFGQMKEDVFGYESTEACLVKHIKRFPAGSNGIYDSYKKKLSISKYWETKEHLIKVPDRYEEQVEQFRSLFIDACKIRMRSDVPIGTALSGGLDSSATICTMAHINHSLKEERVSQDWQHAFVASFPETFLDETVYARKVTDHLNIKSNFINIDGGNAIGNLENYLYHFEEIYLTSPVPMMDTYKAIRDGGVIVSIDGHGADELLSGYGKDIFQALLDCRFNLKKINTILQTYRDLRGIDHDQIRKENIGLHTYYETLLHKYSGRKGVIKELLTYLSGISRQENPAKGEYGNFNQLLYSHYHRTILPTLLRNYDRYSMANGIEIRMPFMDYRVASFCFSLPWESKLRGGYIKTIVRDAMKGIVPDEIRLRKTKIGFNTPIVDWMKGPWKTYLLDTIHSDDFNNCRLIDNTYVRNKILHIINDDNVTYPEGERAWHVLMPYLWEKSFLKRNYAFNG